ncbi:MAG: DUF5671 domain-containing protein [Patescibacteria group bacterium]
MKSTPKDVFLHLLAIITLYVSAVSLLILLFQYINVAFPDALNSYRDYGGMIRSALAALIIVFPVFFWVSTLLERERTKNPERANLWIRRWLISFTLFVAALAIIGDLITLIRFFLEGEITIRFILKVLAVFAVAGSIFGYYLADFRRQGSAAMPARSKMLVWIATGGVCLAIISGFFVAGSPFRQREIRFDQTRVANLQEIQWRIVNYWQQKDVLPKTLADLEDSISGFIVPQDPETGLPYEYNVQGALSFELCADFLRPATDAVIGRSTPFPAVPGEGLDTWNHPAGYFCFERTIDPDLYGNPPQKL